MLLYSVYYVSGFGKTLHKAGEHVFMYKLIKINICNFDNTHYSPMGRSMAYCAR